MTTLLDGTSGLIASWGPSLIVKATAVLLLILLAVGVARHSRAALRHFWLASSFVVLLATPLASMFVPAVAIQVAPASSMLAEYIAEPMAMPTGPVVTAPVMQTTAASPVRRWTPPLAEIVTVVWLTGVFVCAMPVAVGVVQLRRLRRKSLPWLKGQHLLNVLVRDTRLRGSVEVALHESVDAPATGGIIRHVILFPTDAPTWPDENIVRAAVHELEHVRRGDCLINVLTRVVCAFYWFHPLVWVAWRRLGLEAERACDDAVLRNAEATTYADQLVVLARRVTANMRHPLLAMANRHDLVQRVAAVLDERQARGRVGPTAAGVTTLAAVTLTLAISPLQAVGRLPVGTLGLSGALVTADMQLTDTAGAAPGPFAERGARPSVAMNPPPTGLSALGGGVERGGRAPAQAPAAAQTLAVPSMAFDVASIKRNKQAEQARAAIPPNVTVYAARAQTLPGGRFLGRGMSAHELIRDAYGYRNRAWSDIVGAPRWIDEERYDVEAKAAVELPPSTSVGLPPRGQAALRALLAERFNLKVRIEMQRRPVYELVIHRADGRLGPNLKPAEGGCVPFFEREPVNVGMVIAKPSADEPAPLPPCGTAATAGGILAVNMTLTDFVRILQVRPQINRPVFDRTGLTGRFDILIRADADASATGLLPPLKPYIESQLGLTLKDTEALVDTLVIENIDRPTEN
jgi:uncharacterized protein (TIGR03435 family)